MSKEVLNKLQNYLITKLNCTQEYAEIVLLKINQGKWRGVESAPRGVDLALIVEGVNDIGNGHITIGRFDKSWLDAKGDKINPSFYIDL